MFSQQLAFPPHLTEDHFNGENQYRHEETDCPGPAMQP